MRERFARVASRVSDTVGSPWAFLIAVATVIVWAVTGPIFHYSDTWQLVINTGTTIVTFLMVFLIQNTQNRDTKAMHLKLDELLRAVKGAREGEFIDLEKMDDEQVRRLHDELVRRAGVGEAHRAADHEREAVKRKSRSRTNGAPPGR